MRVLSPLLIARRFLASPGASAFHRIRGAVVGVGLSVVPLIVVIHVAGGMVEGITRRFIETGTYHLQVLPRGATTSESLETFADKIRDLEGVSFVTVERQGLALLSSDTERMGASVRAVAPAVYERNPQFNDYVRLTAGSFDVSTASSIVLGQEVARELSLTVGDEARLVTFRTIPGGGYLPRVSRFTVTGIVSTGYQDLDRVWTFIGYERGARILSAGASRELIGVKIAHPFGLPNALFGGSGLLDMSAGVSQAEREQARRVLASVRELAAGDFWVRTWFDVERSRYMSFRTTKNLLAFIMMLIVVVATVNISSTLVMMVLEKRHEIAILKSTGASPKDVQLIFIFGGFLTGVAGAGLGLVVGLLVTIHVNEILLAIESVTNVVLSLGGMVRGEALSPIEIFNTDFYLEAIPIRLQYRDLLVVVSSTIGLSAVVSLLPARRAAAIRPLQVLQKR